MNSRFYRVGSSKSSGQLQSLSHYRDQELQRSSAAVTEDGTLLEYEALELRIHPPNVRVDNDNPHHTVLIIDSANRPGTLVEVVQCLTELGLSVKHARISSDGGWFVDEFHVSETPAGRVTDPKKLSAIKNVLALPENTGEAAELHTVFQIAGPETPGLLADVTQLLSHNGLEIRTAAAWTFNTRAAIVIGVTERNAAVQDKVKLQRLQQLLTTLVEKSGDNVAVSVEQVEGPVHHERRLHQLLLADAVQACQQLTRLQRQHSLPFPGPVNTGQFAADTDTDADQQVPSTPKQQWQKRMLPPLWTVDQSTGRPYHKEDLRQQLELQQQLQQQQADQQQQQQLEEQYQQQWAAGLQLGVQGHQGLEGPFAAAHVQGLGSAVGPGTPEHTSELPAGVVGATDAVESRDIGPQQAAAAAAAAAPSVAIHTAAAGKAASDASVAAAAAQQASVDKLIALLQPPAPLAHTISLPPDKQAQAQAAATALRQQAAVRHPGATIARAGHSDVLPGVRSGPQEPAQQQQQYEQQQQQQVQQSKAAPLPQPLPAVNLAHAGGVGVAGLPPKAPQGYTGPGILPPAQLLIPSTNDSTATGSTHRHTPSLSAPSSPTFNPRGGAAAVGSVFGRAAAADAAAGSSNGMQPYSPTHMASAAAAAGLLSPRAAHGNVQRSAGVMGLQQQQQQQDMMRMQSSPLASPVASVLDAPEVHIQHSHLFNYWLVEIRCRDRNKLFFDTVCTLSDMRYDIYHATIDSEACGMATQLFYIRPRFGECVWDEPKASVLKAMLVSAVQRRFPPGLRLHVFSGSTVCLQDLVSSFKRHRLTITRCKVRAYDHASHTFYLLNQDGSLPSRQYVQMSCQAAGGELVEAPLDVSNPCVSTVLHSLDARGRFAFSFVTQRAQQRAMAQQQQRAQQGGHHGLTPPGSRGVQAPGGPMDIATGVLVGRGDGGMHGGAGGRRGVLALLRGDSKELEGDQAPKPAGAAAASYHSDQQPSF